MLIISCLILSVTLTYGLTDSFSNHYNKRIKRFLSRKSSKSRFNKEELLNTGQDTKSFPTDNKQKQVQGGTKKVYTQQELVEIKRILLKKEDDYYGILNINKGATADVITEAYKKLTLRVHPDKLQVSGATEATQRLNKARAELLKQYENQNKPTVRTSTLNNNDDQQASDVDDKSNSITTLSPSSLKKKKQPTKANLTDNKSKYIGFILILLLIGIIISVIYWKKRQLSTHNNASKKQKTSRPYDSPGSVDSETITMNRNSEASFAFDDE